MKGLILFINESFPEWFVPFSVWYPPWQSFHIFELKMFLSSIELPIIICHWGLAVKPAQCYKWFIWINVVGQMWCNHINQHLTNCNILPLKLSFHCFLVSISQCDNKEWGYPGFPEKGRTSKQVSLCSVIEIAVEIAVFSKDNLKINKNGQHFYQRTYKKLFLSNKMMWYIVKGTNFPFL